MHISYNQGKRRYNLKFEERGKNDIRKQTYLWRRRWRSYTPFRSQLHYRCSYWTYRTWFSYNIRTSSWSPPSSSGFSTSPLVMSVVAEKSYVHQEVPEERKILEKSSASSTAALSTPWSKRWILYRSVRWRQLWNGKLVMRKNVWVYDRREYYNRVNGKQVFGKRNTVRFFYQYFQCYTLKLYLYSTIVVLQIMLFITIIFTFLT